MPRQIVANVTGTVWKVEVAEGNQAKEGDELMIIESMKMEVPVTAPCDCKVLEIRYEEGEAIEEGETLMVVEES